MKRKLPSVLLLTLVSLASLSVLPTFAQNAYDADQKTFAVALERAISDIEDASADVDQNEMALAVHQASKPGGELYSPMKPELDKYDPVLSDQVNQILSDLGDQVKNSLDTKTAQGYLNNAKQMLEATRTKVLGQTLDSNIQFKFVIINELLENSIGEYGEGVLDGKIIKISGFQESSGMIKRSQELYDEIKAQLPAEQVSEIDQAYSNLADAYAKKAPVADVDPLINKVKEAFGGQEEESSSTDVSVYLVNVKNLLNQAKDEYSKGNNTGAQDLVTQAYLNNFEYIEPTLAKSNQSLEIDLEKMIREDLRGMIKNGASVSDVSSEIDTIQSKLDTIAPAVPEFGPLAGSILVLAVAAVIAMRIKNNKLVSHM